jgi:hypothetical protein
MLFASIKISAKLKLFDQIMAYLTLIKINFRCPENSCSMIYFEDTDLPPLLAKRGFDQK